MKNIYILCLDHGFAQDLGSSGQMGAVGNSDPDLFLATGFEIALSFNRGKK